MGEQISPVGTDACSAGVRRTRLHRGKSISAAEFARLWCDPAIPLRDIAERLDITPQAVRSRAVYRGLPQRRGGSGWNRKLDPVLFRQMWDANVGRAEIADHFGMTNPTSVSRAARLWGFPKRDCGKWNAITALTFFMARAARVEQAAMINAEMVDRGWEGRAVGLQHARGRA